MFIILLVFVKPVNGRQLLFNVYTGDDILIKSPGVCYTKKTKLTAKLIIINLCSAVLLGFPCVKQYFLGSLFQLLCTLLHAAILLLKFLQPAKEKITFNQGVFVTITSMYGILSQRSGK